MSSSTLVTNVARYLGDLSMFDKLTASAASNYTSFTVVSDATNRWEAGDVGDFLADGTYDIFRVPATAATSLTVDGGLLGSTQAAHSSGAFLRKRPRFWAKDIDKALDDSLLSDLYPDIFAVYQTQLTPSSTNVYYSIPLAVEDILSVYQKPDTGNDLQWLSGWSQPTYADTTLSATNKAMRIPSLKHSSNTIFVSYARIPQLSDLSDAGQKIIEYGACARLLEWEGTEQVAVNRPQGGTVVPGQYQRDARWFRQEQAALIATERKTLNRRFPMRKRMWIGPRHVTSGSNGGYFASLS